MADYKLIGKNYQTPDLVAKVTGKAKYAEDYRADGMVFCKLLLSPMPHARVRSIDASAALKMPGVHGILTADDMPAPPPPAAPPNAQAPAPPNIKAEVALTNEPVYQGEPILALAADDELTAAEAIEKIVIDFEPLPFIVDPIQALKPGSPNARLEGNAYVGTQVQTVKWTDEDVKELNAGRLPMRDTPDGWKVGDVDAGFKDAALIIDETVVHQSTSHQPLETRTGMARWENGKLYLYGSTQSLAQTVPNVARLVGIEPSNVVLISEYTGGGFGSKIPGSQSMAIPALLSKKIGRPVMMRISREEEHYIGRARAGLHARAKIGFRKDGRITAIDLLVVMDNGPYAKQGDMGTCATVASAAYQPLNMRYRGIAVLTNTPPRISQRAPGGEQSTTMLDPLISMAARKLGIDQVEIRKINAPTTGAAFGAANAQGSRNTLTGAFVREALDKGAELFKWDERKQRIKEKRGSKVRGLGVGVANFTAGSIGFDGLLVISPEDGRLMIHQGIGNLGTLSVHDTARVAAEVLDMPWDRCEVVWGNMEKNPPWSCSQGGSQTTHAHSRANHAVAMDAKTKLQEIAAKDLGGRPEDYDVGNGRVFRKGNPNGGLTFAQAAKRAIALGGKYDGHELPKDINVMTKASATAVAGQGLVAVARDNYGRKGNTQSFVAGFAEVEVDTETGEYRILDYLAVADVGTVLHPRGLEGQLHGGGIQGIGQARCQKWVYDEQYGVSLARRFHHNKPPTILDIPHSMEWAAVGIPDPQSPVGAKGVGEPAVGAGSSAVLSALADALGDDMLRRTPVTPDMILASVDAGKRVDAGLQTHV